jgi:hypothetical protein
LPRETVEQVAAGHVAGSSVGTVGFRGWRRGRPGRRVRARQPNGFIAEAADECGESLAC